LILDRINTPDSVTPIERTLSTRTVIYLSQSLTRRAGWQSMICWALPNLT